MKHAIYINVYISTLYMFQKLCVCLFFAKYFFQIIFWKYLRLCILSPGNHPSVNRRNAWLRDFNVTCLSYIMDSFVVYSFLLVVHIFICFVFDWALNRGEHELISLFFFWYIFCFSFQFNILQWVIFFHIPISFSIFVYIIWIYIFKNVHFKATIRLFFLVIYDHYIAVDLQ